MPFTANALMASKGKMSFLAKGLLDGKVFMSFAANALMAGKRKMSFLTEGLSDGKVRMPFAANALTLCHLEEPFGTRY